MNTHMWKPAIVLSGKMKRRSEEMEQMEVEGGPSTSQDRECAICHGKFKGARGLGVHMTRMHKRRRNAVVTPNDIVHQDTAASTTTEAMEEEISPTIEAEALQAQTPSRNIEWGDMKGIQEIKRRVKATHQKIIV